MARQGCSHWTTTAALVLVLAVAGHVRGSSGQCVDAAKALAEHNKFRAVHGAPALTWSSDIAKTALAHAKKMAAQGCKLSPYATGTYGQNLAAFYGYPTAQCVAAVDLWYGQAKNYKYTKTPFTDNVMAGKQVGSFTQLVWKGSKVLGCGAATNATELCFAAICLYSPFGNVQGNQFYLENVLPPINSTSKKPPPPPAKKASPPPAPLRVPPSPPAKRSPPSPPRSSTKPPPPVGCTDAFNFCTDWKTKGYCAPQWLFDDKPVATTWCKKTCGKC